MERKRALIRLHRRRIHNHQREPDDHEPGEKSRVDVTLAELWKIWGRGLSGGRKEGKQMNLLTLDIDLK